MAYCVNCGQQIESTAFCPNCGAPQQRQPQHAAQSVPQPAPMPQQPMYGVPQQPTASAPYPYQNPAAYPAAPVANDSGSFGWAVLGFFIPIVGLILYLVWKNTKPRCASRAGKGAAIGFGFTLACNAISACAAMLA